MVQSSIAQQSTFTATFTAKDGKVKKGCVVMLVGYTDPEEE